MNQLTVPVLTMSSRDTTDRALDAQIEPLNSMGYIQNWIHPQAALFGGL